MEKTVLLVKIGPSIQEGMDYYEATQGNWKVSNARIERGEIQYVAGIDNRKSKKVVCLFTPESWHTVEIGADSGKKYFKGTEAPREMINQLNNINEHVLSRFGYGVMAYIKLSEIESLNS